MDELQELLLLEDRTPERRIFIGLTESSVEAAMWRACKQAGITNYHPHDLRHRRLSLWHGQGVPARVLAERAGHAHASMSLDIYSHVIDPGDDEWLA
jgi:integrase